MKFHEMLISQENITCILILQLKKKKKKEKENDKNVYSILNKAYDRFLFIYKKATFT